MTTDLLPWLLDSDPALRWQVERDLCGAPAEVWTASRDRIGDEGFGAGLLSRQDPDGQWAGGAFFPRGWTGDGPQPWTATTWTLNTLREWGMDAAVLRERRTAESLAEHSRWEYDGSPYWRGEVDCCINAWTVANGLWLGADRDDVEHVVRWLVEHRLPDGGWNCEWVEGSTRSSVHSTLNALKGLLAYDTATGGTAATRAARHGGEEYLLARGLFRRLSSGAPIGPWTTEFSYPFRWRYDVLNAADYFRRRSALDGTGPDPRLAEAMERIRAARASDGSWPQHRRDPGRVWFEVDADAGQPSKWLTLFGTRLLNWWDT